MFQDNKALKKCKCTATVWTMTKVLIFALTSYGSWYMWLKQQTIQTQNIFNLIANYWLSQDSNTNLKRFLAVNRLNFFYKIWEISLNIGFKVKISQTWTKLNLQDLIMHIWDRMIYFAAFTSNKISTFSILWNLLAHKSSNFNFA